MGTKKWYKSWGVDGSLAGIITTLLLLGMGIFGIDAATEQSSITEIVTTAIALIGAVVALVGRLKAKDEIG